LQRRFLEIDETIEMRDDPVATREHLARYLGVAALVGIEQRTAEQHREPDQREYTGRHDQRSAPAINVHDGA
jgi:hypothetical protein